MNSQNGNIHTIITLIKILHNMPTVNSYQLPSQVYQPSPKTYQLLNQYSPQQNYMTIIPQYSSYHILVDKGTIENKNGLWVAPT